MSAFVLFINQINEFIASFQLQKKLHAKLSLVYTSVFGID